MRQTDWYELPIRREAEALRDAGFDVEVLCMADRGGARREVVDGVELTMLPTSLTKSSKVSYLTGYARFFVRVAVTLALRHLRRPYAVIQVNTMPDFLVFAAVVPKLTGSRVVAYMHEPTPELAATLFGTGAASRVLARIEQWVLRFADRAIAVTEQHRQRYAERGADAGRITVVLNGVDPAHRLGAWTPPADERPTGKFTVISHGAVEDRYGQDTIVEAARLLRNELPELEVVLVGRGSCVARTLAQIEAAQLQDVVRFEGWVSEERLNDLLHFADAGVVAQKASPYSHLVHTNKMVDYWIFGLPVIASRLRAVAETYDDSVLEYFEPGDPQDLARAIRRLHGDPSRREELARNGRTAHERHGWPVQRRVYLSVFDGLFPEDGGGGGQGRLRTRRPRARLGRRSEAAPSPPTPRLERLLQPQLAMPESTPSAGAPCWLRAPDWRVLARPRPRDADAGDVIERFALPSGTSLSAVRGSDGVVSVPFDLEEAYANLVTESWLAAVPLRAPTERQLQLYYAAKRVMPAALLLRARHAYARRAGSPEFPRWPFENAVDRLVRFTARCLLEAADVEEAEFAWFWPGRHRAALVLTHDVESGAGLRRALEIAELEEERGLRSSFNVVVNEYELDAGILSELDHRGFEIGLHGLRHDRSLFSSRASFVRQLPELAAAAQRLGAQGFRSPSTYRVVDWIHELPVAYDCSISHSDPYEPRPGGSCTLWPYMLGNVVELPYTLPQDHTLFTVLRQRTVQPWLQQLATIEARGGLVQCVSHPDPGYLADADKRALYAEFLDAVAEREGLWKPLPREAAVWWRRRELGETQPPEQLPGRMRRGDRREYALLEPPPAAPASTG